MSEKETPLTEAFFYILLALRRPNHGYGVIQEVEELTKGRVVLADYAEERLDQDLQSGYGIKEKERVYYHRYRTECI